MISPSFFAFIVVSCYENNRSTNHGHVQCMAWLMLELAQLKKYYALAYKSHNNITSS